MSGPFMPPQQQMKPKPIMDRMPQGGPVTRGNTGYGQIAAGKALGVDPSTLRQQPGLPQRASSTPRPQAVPTRTPATPQPQPNPAPQAPPAAPPPAAGLSPMDQRIAAAGLSQPQIPLPRPKPADLAAQVPTQDLDARIAQAASQMQGKRNAFPGVGGPAPAAPVPAPTLPTPAPPAQPGVGATIYDMLVVTHARYGQQSSGIPSRSRAYPSCRSCHMGSGSRSRTGSYAYATIPCTITRT